MNNGFVPQFKSNGSWNTYIRDLEGILNQIKQGVGVAYPRDGNLAKLTNKYTYGVIF